MALIHSDLFRLASGIRLPESLFLWFYYYFFFSFLFYFFFSLSFFLSFFSGSVLWFSIVWKSKDEDIDAFFPLTFVSVFHVLDG